LAGTKYPKSKIQDRKNDPIKKALQCPIHKRIQSNKPLPPSLNLSAQQTMANRGKGYGPPLDNISQTVGNTPLVKISERICPPGRTIYAKCEFFNPLSSVKDRLALSIIEAAEKDGSLKPGQTVVEATSGNTGIGK
jgi:hypothetical protein